MDLLNDEELIRLYEKAFKYQLDHSFIELLLIEMNKRNLKSVSSTVREV